MRDPIYTQILCRIWNFDLKGNQMKKFCSKHNCTYFSNLFTILDTVFLDTDTYIFTQIKRLELFLKTVFVVLIMIFYKKSSFHKVWESTKPLSWSKLAIFETFSILTDVDNFVIFAHIHHWWGKTFPLSSFLQVHTGWIG